MAAWEGSHIEAGCPTEGATSGNARTNRKFVAGAGGKWWVVSRESWLSSWADMMKLGKWQAERDVVCWLLLCLKG